MQWRAEQSFQLQKPESPLLFMAQKRDLPSLDSLSVLTAIHMIDEIMIDANVGNL